MERFHIASSDNFISYLKKTESLFIYNLEYDKYNLNKEQQLLAHRKEKIKELIDDYSDKFYEHTMETDDNDKKPFSWCNKFILLYF